MKIQITGRHMNVTSALREYVQSRFGRLDRYGLKGGSLQIVLGVEKLQHKAEVVGTVNGKRIQAKTSTREMYATIDALADRVDAQFRKWKERLADHKPNKMRVAREPIRRPVKWGKESRVEVEHVAVPVLSIEGAKEHFGEKQPLEPFMMFINADTGTLQVLQRVNGGRLSVFEPYPEGGPMRPRQSLIS